MKNEFIYLDYQASTPIFPSSLQKMQPYLTESFANPHSSQHIAGLNSFKSIEKAKVKIAQFINADPNEIIFTSGATEANNLALFGMCHENPIRKRILISSIEHKCVMAPAHHLSKLGYEVIHIPVTPDGIIDTKKFESLLDDNVFFVSIMAVNNEIGSIQPIEECASLAKSVGAFFHTDAAQAPMCLELDVHKMNLDLISLSSHKMCGPKGIGALFISNEIQNQIRPIILGGEQQNGIRSGTLPTHLCVGFGEAASYLQTNRKAIFDEIRDRRNYFYNQLNKVADIKLIGPNLNNRHLGNLNLAFPQIDAEELLLILQTEIAASTGSACTSGIMEPSHVLTAIGIDTNTVDSCIRFSFGIGQTNKQLDLAVAKINNAICQIKNRQ
uniref:Cysteine desulfurase n=1 Tax=OCS116 cluster bacterium TaxID=2030921 RepID=A0A2A4ZAT9_9PROT